MNRSELLSKVDHTLLAPQATWAQIEACLLYTSNYPGGPQAGIDEGCFIDLNPYLDEYMPDYKAALDCSDGSFASWE